MKKLFIFIIALSLAGCNQVKKSPNSEKKTAGISSTEKMTLNGIPYDEADKLVRNFLNNRISSDNKTNIWFSQAFIESIDTILKNENGDGIRIYFAKKDDKKNTIIIVSTREGGSYPCKPGEKCPPSGKFHQDYFEHVTSLITSLQNKYEEDYGTARGTNTETSCPDEKNCTIDQNYVSCDDVHAWIENFRGGRINTVSIWYSIGLIHKLKAELAAANAKGKKADGVRIYFTKNNNQNGLIWVTTIADGNVHRDYYECYNKFFDGNNHGEECPVFCAGTTWE